MPIELSLSDATIWSDTLELSIMILEVSFKLIYDVNSRGITYDGHHQSSIDNHNMFIVQASG